MSTRRPGHRARSSRRRCSTALVGRAADRDDQVLPAGRWSQAVLKDWVTWSAGRRALAAASAAW